jgi:hypothetical protein
MTARSNVEIKAGATYFVVVFLVAFMLGIIRVLVLAPRLGEVVSVSTEAPLILAVSWFASRWATAKFSLTNEVSSRLAMGAVAFALLMIVELAVSTLAFGKPIEDYFTAFWSPQGAIGLGTQLIFALVPLMQGTRSVRRA